MSDAYFVYDLSWFKYTWNKYWEHYMKESGLVYTVGNCEQFAIESAVWGYRGVRRKYPEEDVISSLLKVHCKVGGKSLNGIKDSYHATNTVFTHENEKVQGHLWEPQNKMWVTFQYAKDNFVELLDVDD